ncbi:MAG: glycosyltransferase [Pedococcus sp.]
MRVATTKGTLRIPPTYFAVAHAARMTEVDSQVFTLVADIADPTIGVPVHEAVPRLGRTFRQRELVMPAFMPVMSAKVRGFQPDLVHQHFATWSAPAVAGAHGRAPLLMTLHGVDTFVTMSPARTAMARWHRYNVGLAQRHSARFLAVSRYLADASATVGFDPGRVEVHYQGVDTDYFTPASGPARGPDRDGLPLVLFVGALAQRKGLPDVLEASHRLGGSVPHRLVIAGSGPMRPLADDFAARHAGVTVSGGLQRSEVRELMRQADVLVMPSQREGTWCEAAGLVALEAQSCGTPVVAYRNGGIPEMVVDGSTGRLVDERDVAGLESALREVLSFSEADRLEMRGASRSWVVGHRSLAGSCAELLRHYDELTS